MNPLMLEWVEKAEKDYAAAQWLRQAPMPAHDAVCFHSHQCIEKYFKSLASRSRYAFSSYARTGRVAGSHCKHHADWNIWRSDFVALTTHAVDFRYPGKSATADDAHHAMRICENVRQAIRESLAIPS